MPPTRRTFNVWFILSITAWAAVFSASVIISLFLRKYDLRDSWVSCVVIGVLNLAAHLVDYFITLKICPDLSFEANPLWTPVVSNLGLGIAKWYGFTGKIFLSILSFQFFAIYLKTREKLYPKKYGGFWDFCKSFGSPGRKRVIDFGVIVNFYCFMFSMVGIFCFYVAFQNTISDPDVFRNIPPFTLVLLTYLVMLTGLYMSITYRSARNVD